MSDSERRPRILMIGSRNVPVPPVRGGAIEWWMWNVAHRIGGFDVTILSPADPALPMEETRGSVTVRRIAESRAYRKVSDALGWDPYSYARRAAGLLRGEPPDLIHVFNTPKAVIELRRAFPNAKIIFHVMNLYEQLGRRGRTAPGTEIPADLFVGCSEFIVRAEQDRLGRGARATRVITNAVDTEVYQPWWNSKARAEVRESLLLTGYKMILYSGRLSANKGIDKLIDAMPEVARRQPKARLVILGSRGFGADGARRDAFTAALAKKAEAAREFVLFGGFVAPEKIHQYYEAADLFVAPAVWQEPFAFVHLEASAAGLPIVATPTGGTPELIRDGVNGVFVSDPSNVSELAGAIAGLLDDPARCRALGEAARRTVEERHTWPRVAQDVESVYNKLLADKQAAGR